MSGGLSGGAFPSFYGKGGCFCAAEKGLEHEETHSKVEYIVAHGIASSVEGQKVVIGSYHFVFEDEACTIDPAEQEKFDALPKEYSHLYLAIDGRLAAVICIEDPLRAEAAEVISNLRALGLKRIVMMTGITSTPRQQSQKRSALRNTFPRFCRRIRRNLYARKQKRATRLL